MKALIKRFILINMCKSLYKTTTRVSRMCFFLFLFFRFHMWSISFHGKWDGFFRVGFKFCFKAFRDFFCVLFLNCVDDARKAFQIYPLHYSVMALDIHTHTYYYIVMGQMRWNTASLSL